VWALRDCTLEVPAGAIAGLVGPNGAGKTTLLEMIIGLLEPTEGQVSVFGVTSRAQVAARLARVSYVAQNHPLYRDFSVADMFRLGRAMNPSWDQGLAQARMDALGIPVKRKVKTLSGGQQAQVSLTMALAARRAQPGAAVDHLRGRVLLRGRGRHPHERRCRAAQGHAGRR
jgi:ABC-2 type transport system ATP-binding protein